MEFVIHRNDLVRELQTVTGVVEKRATIPILANLLLEAQKGELLVGASDLEVTIRGSAKATVVREGSITLPAQKLHDIAKSLPEAEVSFKVQDRHQVAIHCERTKFRIAGQPRDDFPQLPQAEFAKGMEVPAGVLRGLIDRTIFAITTEDHRYSLNGALCLVKPGSITFVATDGHRLAYASQKVDVKLPKGDELRSIVPRKALNQLAHLSADGDPASPVKLGRTGNQMFFGVGRHVLTTTLLEGQFPEFEKVMPKSCDTTLVLPTADIGDALRRVSLLSSDRHSRAIQFSLSDGKLDLSSETEMGRAEESLAVDYTGADVAIGFNAKYLLDFLGVVGTGTVALELNPRRPGEEEAGGARAGDKPGQLRPHDGGDLDYRYVVMPMQL